MMKAIQISGPGAPLEFVERAIPLPGANQLEQAPFAFARMINSQTRFRAVLKMD